MKQVYICAFCKKQFERFECYMKGKKHTFCCRKCLADFSNKAKNPKGYLSLKDYTNMAAKFSRLAKELNPTRMTPETRQKIRESHLGRTSKLTAETRAKIRNARLGKGKGKSYTKYYGRHEHRVVAEQMLGRELKPEEVVHHIDGDPKNNSPDNIFVFCSQREHAEHHAFLRYTLGEGGDAE